MGFLDKLFGKASAKPAAKAASSSHGKSWVKVEPTSEETAMIERLIELMRSHARDCVAYDITDDAAGLFDSKVGGHSVCLSARGFPK